MVTGTVQHSSDGGYNYGAFKNSANETAWWKRACNGPV